MAFVKFNGGGFKPDPKPEPKPKSKPKKIKPRSDKRAEQEKVYSTLRKIFLQGKVCPITGEPATQVHHRKGRTGELLTDVRFFLGVSATGHEKIEAEPEWAKSMGYSLDRLSNENECNNEDKECSGIDSADVHSPGGKGLSS